MHARRTHRKTVVASIVAGLLVVGGVALAAILLTTSITGSVSATTKHASDKVTSVKVVASDDLVCTVSHTDDAVTINAKADQVVGEDGSQGSDDLAGSCDIQGTIANTGDVDLYVTGVDVDTPNGWSIKWVKDVDDPDSKLPVGGSETSVYRLSVANGAATSGQISGTITTSPDPTP